MERKPQAKWGTHLSYGALIASLIGGGGFYHATHPILKTINRAINTANKATDLNIHGHLGGCVPFDLNGTL